MKRVMPGLLSFHPGSKLGAGCASQNLPTRLLAILLLTTVLLAGCGGDKSDTGEQARDTSGDEGVSLSTNRAEFPCGLTVDYWGLTSFQNLMEPVLFSAPDPTPEQLTSFIGLPAYRLLVETSDRALLNRKTLRADLSGLSDLPAEDSMERRALRLSPTQENFLYVHRYRDEIWSLLNDYIAPGNLNGPCRIRQLLDGYVSAEDMPAGLDLVFMVMSPEVRYQDEKILVDAGLAQAAGHDQLNRIIASTIYKAMAEPDGPLPSEREGADAIAATFERVCYLAVATWLEDYMDMVLDSRHPLLGHSQEFRLQVIEKGRRAIGECNQLLGQLSNISEVTPAQSVFIHDSLVGKGAYDALGFSMAALIEDRSGVAALKACAGKPVRFLKTFQELALQNEAGIAPTLDNLTAFDPEGFRLLLQIMESSGYSAD